MWRVRIRVGMACDAIACSERAGKLALVSLLLHISHRLIQVLHSPHAIVCMDVRTLISMSHIKLYR